MTHSPTTTTTAAGPIADLTADTLLAIPLERPGLLFPDGPEASRRLWRELARHWHPDRCAHPRAAEVFGHLVELHRRAAQCREMGVWFGPRSAHLHPVDGATRTYRARRFHPTELGWTIVGPRHHLSLINDRHPDLAHRAAANINRLQSGQAFAGGAMAIEMARWLPRLDERFSLPNHHVQVLVAEPDQVLLADLLDHHGGHLDGRHLAWIIGGMLHVACYLEWAGLTHNAIGPDTWLVSPAHHSGTLAGGWAYATPEGERLVAAPARTVDTASNAWRRRRIATTTVDRELIRRTGREALSADGPTPLVAWFDQPQPARAVDDYAAWVAAVHACYGPPRFHRLATTPDQVYPPNTAVDGRRPAV